METIDQTVTTASGSITRFAQRSQDIGTILDVIQGIVEQTSLLALNASIIAAQAGSHGRGFAVVAEEIKNLADGVRASTKDIGAIVTTLKTETQQVVHNIHEGAEKVKTGVSQTQQARETLRKIIDSAERSSLVVTEIAETLHGLLQNSRQIAAAMTRVSTMTTDIMRATNEQQTSTVQISTAVEHINDMAAQIHQAAAEQLTGVHQLLDASQQITFMMSQNRKSSHQIGETTKELSLQAEMLLQTVDRFKLCQENQNIEDFTRENAMLI
ncbi:methyl-accepting chemotaxis protein [Candidatus Vecturithrix granuli]|uniref:Methyl-accepting chemotaxis protein n=1 Tax=Vecturithrix granuli TaxID=1499967 RepID=A0A0S6WAB6_VECG1|nr:methyl-accepting chemotaxis protein [Candidatus Vecturithrix granuli]